MYVRSQNGCIAFVFVLILLGTFHAFYASALTRPVDQKIFCGEGYTGYQSAIAYIKTRTSGNQSSIDGLTPEFACGLAGFLKAAPPGITVGVGTYQVTASVKTHGVEYCQHRQCIEGTNSHPRGLAADLLYNGSKLSGGAGASAACRQNALCTWAHQNAGQYGLMFRLMPESGCQAGYYEPWHIEAQGVGGCGGSGSSSGGLSGGPGDLLRDALAPAEQTPTATTTQQMATSSVSATSTININSLFGTSSSSSDTTSTPENTTSENSIADRLQELAFGSPAASTTAATSVPLVVSGRDATGLTSLHGNATSGVLANGLYSISQQTFFSKDLSWEGDEEIHGQPLSGWEAILMTIKVTLLRMLQMLTPFKSPDPYAEYNLQ